MLGLDDCGLASWFNEHRVRQIRQILDEELPLNDTSCGFSAISTSR